MDLKLLNATKCSLFPNQDPFFSILQKHFQDKPRLFTFTHLWIGGQIKTHELSKTFITLILNQQSSEGSLVDGRKIYEIKITLL